VARANRVHPEDTRAVVLLISPFFFLRLHGDSGSGSPEECADGGVTVLPIIVSPCLYEEAIFKYPDPAGPGVPKAELATIGQSSPGADRNARVTESRLAPSS
jgi:hypothetical protein